MPSTNIKSELRNLADVLEQVVFAFQDNNKIERYKTIKILEEKADAIVHKISNALAFDHTRVAEEKEDIRRLTEAVDDVIDNLTDIAFLLTIYPAHQYYNYFLEIIDEAAEYLKQNIYLITNKNWQNKIFEIENFIKEIHRLENIGDNYYKSALVEFAKRKFNNVQEIKDNIIYLRTIEYLERTLDALEDAADIIDLIRLKGGV